MAISKKSDKSKFVVKSKKCVFRFIILFLFSLFFLTLTLSALLSLRLSLSLFLSQYLLRILASSRSFQSLNFRCYYFSGFSFIGQWGRRLPRGYLKSGDGSSDAPYTQCGEQTREKGRVCVCACVQLTPHDRHQTIILEFFNFYI